MAGVVGWSGRRNASSGFVAIAFAAVMLISNRASANQPIAIGTGSPSGLYYSAGIAVCDAVLKLAKYPCTVASTRGSASNILTLDPEKIQFGIVQSDVQFEAAHGHDAYAFIGASENLRSLFSLHAEAFTVVVRSDSPVTEFDQLRGKRLNLGPFGTGTLNTGEEVINHLGWSELDRKFISHTDPSLIRDALCSGEIDASAYLIGHPSDNIAEISKSCSIRLVSLDLETVARIAKNKPYFSAVTIAGTYQGNPDPVTTLGVVATMVTLASVPDDLVYTLVKAFFQALPDIRAQNPAFSDLRERTMISHGLTAPLHPGALRYYREAGWVGPSGDGAPSGNLGSNPEKNPVLRLPTSAQTVPLLSSPKIPPAKEDPNALPSLSPPTGHGDGPEHWDKTPPPFRSSD